MTKLAAKDRGGAMSAVRVTVHWSGGHDTVTIERYKEYWGGDPRPEELGREVDAMTEAVRRAFHRVIDRDEVDS